MAMGQKGALGARSRDETIKLVALVLLVLQTTTSILAIRASRRDAKYLNTSAVVMAELFKWVICATAGIYLRGFTGALQTIHRHTVGSPIDMVKVSVPGAVYTLQNNLIFLALSNLPAATYQVMYQMKLLATVIFSMALLRRTFKPHQYLALLLLFLGVVLVEAPSGSGHGGGGGGMSAGNRVLGLCAVGLACCCSGFGGVFTEMVAKESGVPDFARQIQLATWGLVFGLMASVSNDYAALAQGSFLQGFTATAWLAVLLQSAGGLIIFAVLKYGDNIVKCFGNAIAIILSCVMSYILWAEFEVTWTFVLGVGFVLVATAVYSLGLPQWRQPARQHYTSLDRV